MAAHDEMPSASGSSDGSRLVIRLDALPRDELVKLAAKALTELPKDHPLHSHTDALIAHHKPLPAWCVDRVLLSPDLLPHLVDSLSLDDCGAAAACSAWAAEWTALLRRRRYIKPVAKHIDRAIDRCNRHDMCDTIGMWLIQGLIVSYVIGMGLIVWYVKCEKKIEETPSRCDTFSWYETRCRRT